jgi:hypothetical protein
MDEFSLENFGNVCLGVLFLIHIFRFDFEGCRIDTE